MNANFPRTLSLLRKEKGISQKKAAEELMISQALLSHYENGVREPGLQFVVKAADFYGVSADFLLGRTMARDGTGLHEEDVPDAGEERDNVLRGSAAVLLSKKILTNSIGVLFDLIDRSKNRKLAAEVYGYLGGALYKMFRRLYMAAGSTPEKFFSVSESRFSGGADIHMTLCDMRVAELAADREAPLPPLSNESLERDYPLLYPSLMTLLHNAGKEIAALVSEEEK